MEAIILNVIAASGIIGVIANLLVSGVKSLSQIYKLNFNPRLMAAIASLSGALGVTLNGGSPDMSVIESSVSVILMTGVSWLFAHFLHKSNSV